MIDPAFLRLIIQTGLLISIAYASGKPIVLVGVGQEYEDLNQFDPDWLLKQLFE